MIYVTVPLEAGHKRSAFSCGKRALDDYIRKQARQDMKKRLSVVFVLPDEQGNVAGFYTLSNDSVSYEIVPPEIQKIMPRSYTHLPTTLLGRLAVDQASQGKGLGEKLLLDALKRSFDISTGDIGSAAIVVDPIDGAAEAFYKQYGFIKLPDRGRMFIPMKTVKTLFAR